MVVCGGQLTDYQANKIADAIYKIEGGAKAKVAYGILSVKVNNEAEARKVCLNTIRNNYIRWQKAGKRENYFEFLSRRYCPTTGKNLSTAEKRCNKYWLGNLRKVLGQTYENQEYQKSRR